MPGPEFSRRRFLAGVSGTALAAVGVPEAVANAAGGRPVLDAYVLATPTETMLYLSVVATDRLPTQLSEVQVEIGTAQPLRTVYRDVSAPGGAAVIELAAAPLLAQVSVRVLTRPDQPALRAITRVTEFALDARQPAVADFQGYGGQLNMHLYTALNDPTRGFVGNEPPRDVADVEAKVCAMKPGLVRIFLSPNNYDPANQNRMDSFVRTVELAQRAGASVNITWWFIERDPAHDPDQQQVLMEKDMREFADTLIDLVVNRGLTAVQQITIQNEVNTSWVTPELYEQYYRLLDTFLRQGGIRNRIAFVGGDLVYNNQEVWFTYMADHMGDVLDGWSVHIYWNYWDTAYMMQRLTDVKAIYDGITPDKRKPLAITEFGVRGHKFYDDDPKNPILDANPYRNGALTATLAGYYQNADGTLTPISQTNIDAFQHAWFNMQAVDMGFSAVVKWDLCRAQYDFTYQDYSTVGYLFDPAPGQDRWPLRPVYYVEWLMANTTDRGWQVLECHGSSGAKLIAPFRGTSGQLTVFAMSTDGAAASFCVGDLPPGIRLNTVIWNADGKGRLCHSGSVHVDSTGTISFAAPAESLVCLTTVPVHSAPGH